MKQLRNEKLSPILYSRSLGNWGFLPSVGSQIRGLQERIDYLILGITKFQIFI